MKQRNSLIRQLTERADLPGEPIPGLPLVEIGGDSRVLIENHRGVCEYGTEKICVKVCFGQLCICGSGMTLASMTREQLVIRGRIDSVTLLRGRK